jgi:hypothetical protein
MYVDADDPEGPLDNEDEDEDDEFVIAVLSLCSNDASFRARHTEAQIGISTSLLGSSPQWWVSYKNM